MKLNLGSGTHRHRAGYTNVDANPDLHPDVIAHVPPIPAASSSVEAIFASHFLEHLTKDEANELMREAWRVLVPGGVFEIVVPHAFSPGAHQDPTHRSYWVPESFLYYTPKFRYLGYGLEDRFELVRSQLLGDEVMAELLKTNLLTA